MSSDVTPPVATPFRQTGRPRGPQQQVPRSQVPQRQPRQPTPQRQPRQQPTGQRRSAAQQQTRGGQKVEYGDEYVHVRFRDPNAFDIIRTPDWAAHAAQDVSPGAEARTGKPKGSDERWAGSVLVRHPSTN